MIKFRRYRYLLLMLARFMKKDEEKCVPIVVIVPLAPLMRFEINLLRSNCQRG